MSFVTGSFCPGPSHLKQQLVASFDPFTGHTASPNSVRLAKDCLNSGEPRGDRYELLSFDQYIEWNQNTPSYLTMMTSAYDQLLKYISNLLRPKRPQVWRSIKTNSTAFKARVTCMAGAEDILKQAGYSEVRSDSLCFPDYVTEPDKGMLAVLASEILMAKLEVEQMNSNPQPRGSPRQPVHPPRHPPSTVARPSPYEISQTSQTAPTLPPRARDSTEQFNVESGVLRHFDDGRQISNGAPVSHTSEPRRESPAQPHRPQNSHSPSITRTNSSSSDQATQPVPKRRTKFLKLVQPDPVVDTPVRTQSEENTPMSSLSSTKSSSGEIKSPLVGSEAGDSPSNSVVKNANEFLEQMRLMRREQDQKRKTRQIQFSEPLTSVPVETIPEQSSESVTKDEELYAKDNQDPPPPSPAKRPSQEHTSASAPIERYCTNSDCNVKLNAFCRYCSDCGTPAPPLKACDPDPPLKAPPKPAPRTPTDSKPPPIVPRKGWEPTDNTTTTTPRPKTPEISPKVPPRQPRQPSVEQAPPPIPLKGPNITPQMPNRGAQAASGRSDEDQNSFLQMSGIQHLVEKEKAFKDSQRRDGVPEAQLRPLDELEDRKKEYLASKKSPKKINMDKFPRENTSQNAYPICDPDESRRIHSVATAGRHLLNNVKECVPYGYSLEEIQVASSQDTNGISYLRNQWSEITIQAQRNLSLYQTAHHNRVGVPSSKEMRNALARAGGDIKTAEQQVFQEREKRIIELLGRVGKIRARNPEIPPLLWEGAVNVLSANDMDVDKAFYVLQCDWLKPVYDYIFDESNKKVLVTQLEMVEIKKFLQNKGIDNEIHLRLLMAECKFTKRDDANIVIQLLQETEEPGTDKSIDLQYYIDAAKDHGSLEKARDFLFKECEICYDRNTIHDFVAMPGCIHSICKTCFKDHFTLVIQTQEVKHFTCPCCGEPDMANKDITEGFYLQIFLGLVKEHLDRADFKLCDDKLKDFSLLKDPNFIWCASTECRSGFIHEGRAIDVTCPNCRKSMCRQCKKPWEPTHEGLNCEQFAKWKLDNDPDAQEQGLAAHLQANGIECPGCHFKYDLAKGGCMHFKCVRCPNEFCSGCGESFKIGQACGKLDSCKDKGLHAHHPRDCLFFMRDFDVEELQQFLKDNNIEYDTVAKDVVAPAPAPAPEAEAKPEAEAAEGDPPQAQEEAPAAEEPKENGCIVMLQKETMEGLLDEICGKAVVEGQAGLCTTHYKEYLVDLINKNNLDPVKMYTTIKVEIMLKREEFELPEKDDDDDDDVYREKLVQNVKEKLPLLNKGGVAAPAAPDPQPPIDVDLPPQPAEAEP